MRKVLAIFILSILVFFIYGCKPSLSESLYNSIHYLERYRLHAINDCYFIEVTIGRCSHRDFCKITLMSTNLKSASTNLHYKYGDREGNLEYDSATGNYTAIIDYDKLHSSIMVTSDVGQQKLSLFVLADETPIDDLLLNSYLHFESCFNDEKAFKHRAYIKILSDMSGNAFYYVAFIADDNILAILYDIDTLSIIADYIK